MGARSHSKYNIAISGSLSSSIQHDIGFVHWEILGFLDKPFATSSLGGIQIPSEGPSSQQIQVSEWPQIGKETIVDEMQKS